MDERGDRGRNNMIAIKPHKAHLRHRISGMPTLQQIIEHPAVTDNHGFRYRFTPKHHGADPNAAQWLPSLSLEEEFAVFNSADRHELSDDRGWLYGVSREEGELQDLGTLQQQIAEFPLATPRDAWHGFPVWAVGELAAGNRRGEHMRPQKIVFLKMEQAGLLSARERKRLFKGDHV